MLHYLLRTPLRGGAMYRIEKVFGVCSNISILMRRTTTIWNNTVGHGTLILGINKLPTDSESLLCLRRLS